MIPAFLSEIATLPVFLGVACSYTGMLKSCVDTFRTYIKLWCPLSELCIWCIRNAKFISLKHFSTWIGKSLGWILWSSGSISPCFLLSLTFSGLPLWELLTVLAHCTTVHEDIPLPAMPPVLGVVELPWQSWSAVATQQGRVCEMCFVLSV